MVWRCQAVWAQRGEEHGADAYRGGALTFGDGVDVDITAGPVSWAFRGGAGGDVLHRVP